MALRAEREASSSGVPYVEDVVAGLDRDAAMAQGPAVGVSRFVTSPSAPYQGTRFGLQVAVDGLGARRGSAGSGGACAIR
jgi:hypothetical protein